MEWYAVLALILVVLLAVILGIVLACVLSGQRCTISIQKRTPNQELTRVQMEQEEKRQKKFGSKLKSAFKASSSKLEQPIAPVEDVKTVEFTFKMGDDKKDPEPIVTKQNESSTVLLPVVHTNQAQRDERQKRREELRKKYKL